MKKVCYILISFIYLCFFLLVLIVNLGSTTIEIPYRSKTVFHSLSAQGWGFFTRNPREEAVDIFKIEEGRLKRMTLVNSSASNYFGLSRKSRKIGMEVSIVLGKLKKKEAEWVRVTDEDIVLHNTPINSLESSNLHYLSKGEYLLTKRFATPWAWYNKKNNFIPYEAVRISID